MITKQIKILSDGSDDIASLTISGKEIGFKYGPHDFTKSGDFPFIVLKEIREELEKSNIFLIMNGSRKDVYPSGLSLMGHNAYVQSFGKPCLLDDLVDIFAETSRLDLIGTVKEQLEYHNEWISSFNR